MASEKYINNAVTTLNGAITNSATTLIVASAALFPNTPQFRIIIENEKMLVIGVSGTTFTVIRGVEGTIAVSHANAVVITGILTAGAIDQIIADNCQYGPVTSLPTAEKAGRLYFPSDGTYLYRDNGASWDAIGPIWKMYPPKLTDFTWINQGTAIVTQQGGGLTMSNGVGGDNYKMLKVVAPTPPYKLTAYLMHDYAGWDGQGGIFFRESSTGRFISIQRSVHSIEVLWFNHPTSFNSTKYSLAQNSLNDQHWYQLYHDGTNLNFLRSANGFTFFSDWGQAKNSFFGTGGPDEVGWGISASAVHALTLLSWKFT